jgi:nucleotide-binding universal stress UspA family protein
MSDTKIPGTDTVIDETFGVAITRSLPPPPPSGYAVVVGIDFDVTGDAAMSEALRLADARDDIEIHAVYVLSHNLDSLRADILAKRTTELDDIPGRLRKHIESRFGDLPEKSAQRLALHVRLGAPAEAIHQLAVDVDAELIIVGTHGRTGLRKLALGSVAQKLLETAHCPVLVARRKDYSGLEKTARPEPLCPDCAQARTDSNGDKLWCEWHARPHVRAHVIGYAESFGGGRDPGIVSSH